MTTRILSSDITKPLACAISVFMLILLVAATVMAQGSTSSQPSGGSRRGYILYGDLKIESGADDKRPQMYDVILYSRGNEVLRRQRINNGGRYRFDNIFNGDYALAIENEGVEVARTTVMITGQPGDDIRQDINLQLRSTPTPRTAAGVVDAADAYDRPKNTRANFERSQKEIENKSFPAAINTLKEVVAADPNDYVAWSNLGMVYFLEKDLPNAESSYQSSLKAKPDYFKALLNLGRVQIANKNTEKAVETLEAAVKADPNSAPANFFLGEAYLQQKKGSKAVGALNQALKLDPVGMADAHLRLAMLYTAAGYKDRAAAEYEQFLKKKPDYPERKKLEEFIEANKPKTP